MKRTILGGLLIALAFVPRTTADTTTVVGPLEYSRISVCEWPMGRFLNYYVTDCCGNEIWFTGDLVPRDDAWIDGSVFASGTLIVNGSCTILEVQEVNTCLPPEPDEILDHDRQ